MDTAAYYLQCGLIGHEINPSIAKSPKSFSLRIKYRLIFTSFCWLLIVIHFFERPFWTYDNEVKDTWNNNAIFPSFAVAYLPLVVTIPLTTIFLLGLLAAVVLESGYGKFDWTKRIITPTSILFICILIKLFQNIVNTFGLIFNKNIFLSFSPVGAIILLLIEDRYVANIKYLVNTLPMFIILICILTIGVCCYAGLGYLLFDPFSTERRLFFGDYGDAMWNMLMVLSGSNWPAPIIPAYSDNRLNIIYFIVYLVILNWGLLNFVLGYICSVYRGEQRLLTYNFEKQRYIAFKAAFMRLSPDSHGRVTVESVVQLLQYCHQNYEWHLTLPTREECYALVRALDTLKIGRISFRQFSKFHMCCDNTTLHTHRHQLKYEQSKLYLSHLQQDAEEDDEGFAPFDRVTANEYYNDRFIRSIRYLCAVSLLATYDLLVDATMALLGLLFLTSQHYGVVYLMLALQLIDLLLKTTALGTVSEVLHSYRGSCDCLYVLLLSLFLALERHTEDHYLIDTFLINSSTLLRVYMFPRSILYLELFDAQREKLYDAYRKLVNVSSKSLSFLMLLLFVTMYIFADLGLQLFGGVISKQGTSAENLAPTPYFTSGYWPVNFNDMFSAFVTMFILLHVNNTHVIAGGIRAVTGPWCELFFAAWYVLGVLFLLNILTAFFLTGFSDYVRSVTAKEEDEGDDSTHRTNDAIEGNKSSREKVSQELDVSVRTPASNRSTSPVRHSRPIPLAPSAPSSAKIEVSAQSYYQQPLISPAAAYSEPEPSVLADEDEDCDDDEGHTDSLDDNTLTRAQGHDNNSTSPFRSLVKRQSLVGRIKQFFDFVPRSGSSHLNQAPLAHSFEEGVQPTALINMLPSYNVTPLKSYLTESTISPALHQPLLPTSASSLLRGPPQRSSDLRTYTRYPSYQSVDSSYGTSRYLRSEEDRLLPSPTRLGYSFDPSLEPHDPAPETSLSLKNPADADDFDHDDDDEGPHNRGDETGLSLIGQDRHRHSLLYYLFVLPFNELFRCSVGHDEMMKPYEAAAVLVQCAREGIDHSHFYSRYALYCFRYRHKLSTFFRLSGWVNLLLYIFHKPAWAHSQSSSSLTHATSTTHYHPQFGIPFLPTEYAPYCHLPFILIMTAGLLLEYGYEEEDEEVASHSPSISSESQQIKSNWSSMLGTSSRFFLTVLLLVEAIVYSLGLVTFRSLAWSTWASLTSVLYIFWFDHHSW